MMRPRNPALPRSLDAAALAAIGRAVRAASGAGDRLPDRVRDALEPSLGADLAAVRVHSDREAARLAAALGADAFAAGCDIFLGGDAPAATSGDGLALLAHECAHAVQHAAAPRSTGDAAPRSTGDGAPRSAGAGAPPRLSAPGDDDEIAADHAARAVVGAGRRPSGTGRVPAHTGAAPVAVRPLEDGEALVLRRHASWEHRLLGDAQPGDLNAIAKGLPNRTALLQGIRDFLWMWHQDPDSVTEEMIHARYPYIRTVRLEGSDLLVTYGELNTLPDYFANTTSLAAQPRDILLPVLQAVRQEGYNRVQRLLGGSTASFKDSVGINSGWDFIDLLWETKAIDNLTWNVGPDHTNHYTAVVARNACHFAPFSWYRWQQFHLVARQLATRAHQATDPDTKRQLTYQAWFANGYADHFLQDSFAAGHLVNKTLIMQWFLEWVRDKWYVPVADWDQVKTMTTSAQPGLAARGLYNPASPGDVRDPQTAEEQPTVQERMDTCGVQASGGLSQAQAYQNYLAFLNSTIVQSSSGALHDYFNAKSVWVKSSAHPGGYQLWGDDTMLNGGDGVQIAGETAHASQQAIADLLADGQTSISVQSIWDRLPTQVRDTAGVYRPLQQWNDGLRGLAFDIFPSLHYYVLRAFPRIQHVSVDQTDQARAALAGAVGVAASGR